jgi:hypothetical protein
MKSVIRTDARSPPDLDPDKSSGPSLRLWFISPSVQTDRAKYRISISNASFILVLYGDSAGVLAQSFWPECFVSITEVKCKAV